MLNNFRGKTMVSCNLYVYILYQYNIKFEFIKTRITELRLKSFIVCNDLSWHIDIN